MSRILLAIASTLVIMYVVPFPVYGVLSATTGLEPPSDGSVARFALSVLVVKIGVAFSFVLLFFLARESWVGRWITYALVWWVAFTVMELGQAIMPDYSWLDAGGGIIAEAIYFPLAALVVARTLEARSEDR